MTSDAADKDAVTATVRDYFEGWFDGDVERMRRALHPDLNKRGVSANATGARLSTPSTARQMIGWTAKGEGKAERPAELAIEIRIDDLHEQIATATVHSAVYIEYLQLTRTPQGWRIVNALYMRRNA
jgi:hypothetical protein